jgi:hypothetical protein
MTVGLRNSCLVRTGTKSGEELAGLDEADADAVAKLPTIFFPIQVTEQMVGDSTLPMDWICDHASELHEVLPTHILRAKSVLDLTNRDVQGIERRDDRIFSPADGRTGMTAARTGSY